MKTLEKVKTDPLSKYAPTYPQYLAVVRIEDY
jgi:hypothetical protein